MSKSTWLIILLVAAGAVVFYMSFQAGKPQTGQGVVLQDIFHQQSAAVSSGTPVKADPVPPMAIITSPVNGHETGFAIQVYSFQDHNRAQAALASLKNSGYQAFLIVSDLGDKGTWYRVRVGGIPDDATARQMLEDIRKNYNSGFILKPKT